MKRIGLPLAICVTLLSGCATLDLDNTQYQGSPKSHIAFLQNGKEAEIKSSGDFPTVNLSSDNFIMLVPATELPIRICASNSPVIFLESRLSAPSCFASGSAVERQKKAPLLLSIGNKHGLYPITSTDNGKLYRAIHINGLEGKASKELYLTVFIDRNGNGAFERKESENLILALPREGTAPPRTDEEIETVFEIHRKKIYRAYKRAMRRNPGLEGKVELKLTILPSGKVTKVRVASSTLKYVYFEKKIVDLVEDFQFGPKNVPAVTITYPLDLATYSKKAEPKVAEDKE